MNGWQIAGIPGQITSWGGRLFRLPPVFALILAVLVTVAVFNWVVALEQLERAQAGHRQQALRDTEALARAYANRLDRLISEVDQVTLNIKFIWTRFNGAVRVEELTRAGLFPSEHLLHASIVDRNGILVSGSYPFGEQVSVSDRDYFQRHKQQSTGDLWIGPPRVGRVLGNPVIQFTRRLNTVDGEFDGVVIVSAGLPVFTSFYEPTSLGEHGLLVVAGTDGVVRAASTGPVTHPVTQPVIADVSAFLDKAATPRLLGPEMFFDGKPRFVAWQMLEHYPMIAIVGRSEDEVLSSYATEYRQLINQAYLVSALCLSLLFLVAYLAARHARKRRDIEGIRRAYGVLREGDSVGYFLLRPVPGRAGSLSDFIIVDCTERGAGYLQMHKNALIGTHLSSVFDGRIPERLLAMFRHAAGTSSETFEYQVPENSPFNLNWVRVKIIPAPEGFVVILKDISETREYEQQLVYQAKHDELSGLPNRRWLMESLPAQLDHAKRSGSMLALLFIDLKGFKVVNDTAGHSAGDELIRQTAMRLKTVLRAADHVVRFGGDEFVAIRPGIRGSAEARQLAEGIISAFQHPFKVSDNGLTKIGVSIGISIFPNDAGEAPRLLQYADAAMYTIKSANESAYRFFQLDDHLRLKRDVDTQMELLQALELSQFYLVYQPKVSAVRGLVCGMEALVRWRHPSKGVICPADFIPLVEQNGLTEKLGDLVIEMACAQVALWLASGFSVPPVSINVSPQQLRQGGLLRTLREALRRHAVDPALIQIEITESSVVGHFPEIDERLDALRRMGIKLAIDDFGTGYSSLSQLHRIKADILKIDKSFTDEVVKGEAFAKAIITMAHSLNMTVVAEGVETEEQACVLRWLGCDEFQGYLYSPPVPADVFAELLKDHMFFRPIAADLTN